MGSWLCCPAEPRPLVGGGNGHASPFAVPLATALAEVSEPPPAELPLPSRPAQTQAPPITLGPAPPLGPVATHLIPYALTSLLSQAAAQESSLRALQRLLPAPSDNDVECSPASAAVAACLDGAKALRAQVAAICTAASGGDEGEEGGMESENGTVDDSVAGLHVLVVDDQPLVRRLSSHYLEELGCTSEVLEDGDEVEDALKKPRPMPIGAVLLDILMARSDGSDVAARLRAHGCELPLIAVTAFAGARPLTAFYECGFDVVVGKPLSKASLLRALVEARARRSSRPPVATASSLSPGSEGECG